LRMKDIDLERGQLTVRAGQGDKDRLVMLPQETRDPLFRQINWRSAVHAKDMARGAGCVLLPGALERKFPNAERELGWQYLFAAGRLSSDPRSGKRGRDHVHESAGAGGGATAGGGLDWWEAGGRPDT